MEPNTVILRIEYMGVKSARLTRVRNHGQPRRYSSKKILKPKLRIHFRLSRQDYDQQIPVTIRARDDRIPNWTDTRYHHSAQQDMKWHRYYLVEDKGDWVICQTSFFPCRFFLDNNCTMQIIPQGMDPQHCNIVPWNTYTPYIKNMYKILLREYFSLKNSERIL